MEQEHTRMHTAIAHISTVSLINPLCRFLWTCQCVRWDWSGVKFQHVFLFWSLPHTTFISLIFLHFVNISLSKLCRVLGDWPRPTKQVYCYVEAMQKWPGLTHLSSSCQVEPLHWEAQMLSAPHGSCLFTCLNFMNTSMTDADKIYPPRLKLSVHIHVCHTTVVFQSS